MVNIFSGNARGIYRGHRPLRLIGKFGNATDLFDLPHMHLPFEFCVSAFLLPRRAHCLRALISSVARVVALQRTVLCVRSQVFLLDRLRADPDVSRRCTLVYSKRYGGVLQRAASSRYFKSKSDRPDCVVGRSWIPCLTAMDIDPFAGRACQQARSSRILTVTSVFN